MANNVEDGTQDVSNINNPSNENGSESDTETAPAFHLMNQPSNASSGNSSYSIISEERTFTLFPKLPIELRIKIWKDALPSPRLIRFNYKQSIGDYSSASVICNATNKPFKFAIASKEVYEVFKSSYEKLLIARPTPPGENELFLYVDYRFESLAIPQYLEADLLQSLKFFRKLAIIVDEFPDEEDQKIWDAILDTFPNLTRLDILNSSTAALDTNCAEHQYERKLVKIPLGDGDRIELPAYLAYNGEVRSTLASEYGNLRFMCAVAQRWKTKVLAHMKRRKELSGIEFDICLEAQRAKGDCSWNLEYWVEDKWPTDDDGNKIDAIDANHWHREPVIIKGDMLTECESESVGKLCEDCGRNRWQVSKDAFWLEGQ